ncbi:uncharacterized protein LOC143597878 [Bidens hawaiensis]|uniref:uncharacterized protein LOC143597878 n=1 Tax=Bidens hawaiensis TaxID=980011 RepID=UPI004049DBFB
MESYSNDEEDAFSDTTYEASTEDEELSDSLSMDLEDVDLVTTLNRTNDDPFLNKLCYENMRFHFEKYTDDNVGETLVEGKDDPNIYEDNEGTQHVEKGKIYPIYDPNMNWKDMKPILGDRYENPAQLKFAICCYGVVNGYLLSYKKNETKRLFVVCGNKDVCYSYPFRLWASWMQSEKSFQIKSLNDNHNCSRNYSLGSPVTASWIAKMYLRELIARPFVKIRDMQADVLRDYMVKVSRGQCTRAKLIANDEIEGGLKEHYARIWDYAHEILRSNPGSSVKVGVNGLPDGRELLTATGRDANNQIYPIAWAVVEVENKDNWKWFIECLIDDIGISDGRGLTVISDQHKGLVEAVKDLLPYVEHRQCARHIYANFKKIYNGGFFETGRACESVENGFSESFTSVIMSARRKPIITMLEEIRMFIMERNYTMSKKSLKWEGNVCPAIRDKIRDWSKNSRCFCAAVCLLFSTTFFAVILGCIWAVYMLKWIVIPSGGNMFEVRDGYEAYSVDLDNRECSCRLWQISGIPCLHSTTAIYYTTMTRRNT